MTVTDPKHSPRVSPHCPWWLALVAVAGCAGADERESSAAPSAFSGAIPVPAGDGVTASNGSGFGGTAAGQDVNNANGSEVSSQAGAAEGANPEGISEGGVQVTMQPVDQTGAGGSGGTAVEGAGNGATGEEDVVNGDATAGGAGGGAMVVDGAAGAGMGPSDEGSQGNGEPDLSEPDNGGVPPVEPEPLPGNSQCAGQFFCDGFEAVNPGGSANSALWDTMTNYSVTAATNNVQVSSANAHSGTQALRVIGNAGRSGIITDLPNNDPYFVRAWFQIDSAPLGPVFVGLGTDGNSEIRLRLSNQNWGTINTVGPGDAIRPGGATSGNCPECLTLPTNQWFCAEFFVDDGAQNATLWIDGVQAAEIVNGQGGWPSQPGNPALFLGSMTVQGGQTDVWLDDVAAGPARIGCD